MSKSPGIFHDRGLAKTAAWLGNREEPGRPAWEGHRRNLCCEPGLAVLLDGWAHRAQTRRAALSVWPLLMCALRLPDQRGDMQMNGPR